ncbi:MAG: pyrrolo-quinoline quinone [Armatimonadetes bacterium]|nr:pyrrolo-quinoline quinone [Armatimonadota bacterium]
MWTQHNDNARTGANLKESVLNTRNVNARSFGKLFSRKVDGQVYAQPLYVPHVEVPGRGVHNVVYVATEHNSVYAFDADDPMQPAPLWHVNLGPPCPYTDFYTPPQTDMNEEVGITGTPVINLDNRALYVVAKSKENGNYVQRLHALDLQSGAEMLGGPVVIQAAVPGAGDDNVNGVISFNARQQLQRPGLLLAGGVIYIALGSHGDRDPYHGWVLGYSAATLKRVAVYNTTPSGGEGAIWQAGQGLSADAQGSLYAVTGNGTADAHRGGPDVGECVIRLDTSGKRLSLADWFLPYNYDALNAADNDLGSCGAVLIPNTDLLVCGSKTGTAYVFHRSSLGHFHADGDTQIVQSFLAANRHIHGSPITWTDAAGDTFIYLWGEYDNLKAFKLVDGSFQTTPAAQGTTRAPDGMPGGFLSISADGGKAGTAIVWATHPADANANWNTVPGTLQAFDASDVSKELWNSRQNAARDDLGMFAKFCPPTVVNGKVYVATFSKQLVVYGLLKPPARHRQAGGRPRR